MGFVVGFLKTNNMFIFCLGLCFLANINLEKILPSIRITKYEEQVKRNHNTGATNTKYLVSIFVIY